MGVVSLNGFRTEPGRLADHMAASAEAVEHLKRLGLRAMTLQPLAGTDVGTLATVVNYANGADYAAGVSKIMGDQGWQDFWARVGTEAPAVPVESSLLQDLDAAFQPSADRPLGVVLGIQWRAKPGRMMDFIGHVMQAVPHIERLGGTVRTMQSLVGAYPMTTMVATSFADMDAYGAYTDATNADAQWQEFWAGVMADPTADVVRSGLYLNITG